MIATSLLDRVVRCPACGAAPGCGCHTAVGKRCAPHAKRRATIARMTAPYASFNDALVLNQETAIAYQGEVVLSNELGHHEGIDTRLFFVLFS
jgi:hypothetical protein